MIPGTSEETLSDTDLLAFADDEMQSYIVPLIMSANEEFFVTTKDISVVSGTASYNIPERAIGGRLRSVQMSDGNGGFYDLTRIEPESEDEYTADGGEVAGYVVRGNKIVLIPTPTSSETMRLAYYRRPSRLVALTAVGVLNAAPAASTSLTLSATKPSTFVSGEDVDVVSATAHFDSLSDSNELTAASGTSLTLTTAITASVGDYVCLAGESPIPQIPVELVPLLSQRIVVRACEAMGQPQKAGMAEATSERMRREAMTLLSPRVKGAARPIINRNGPGFGSKRGYRVR
jgi:hypothetical protein